MAATSNSPSADLRERVRLLEAQNRRFKLLGGLLLAAITGGLLMSQSAPVPKEVRAERFVLVGPEGNELGSWASKTLVREWNLRNPDEMDLFATESVTVPELTFKDHEGFDGLRMGIGDGGGEFSLHDVHGRSRIRMTLDSYEYGLEVLDEEGRELVTLGYDDGEGPALTLEQPKSEMRAGVGVRDDWAYVAIGEDNVGGAVLGYAEETALLRLAGAHSEYMYRLYSDGNAAGLELTVNTIKDRQLQPPLARDESDPIQTVEPHDRRDAGPAAMLRISERGFEAAG